MRPCYLRVWLASFSVSNRRTGTSRIHTRNDVARHRYLVLPRCEGLGNAQDHDRATARSQRASKIHHVLKRVQPSRPFLLAGEPVCYLILIDTTIRLEQRPCFLIVLTAGGEVALCLA